MCFPFIVVSVVNGCCLNVCCLQQSEAVHTRRFNDTPAVVPIKKRRIQIRSPSPPPRSPSPQTPLSRSSSPRVISPARSPASGQTPSSVASISPLLGYSSVSSPRSAAPLPVSSSKYQPLACACGELNVPEGANASPFNNGEALETKGQSLSMSSTASHVDMSSRGENEQQPSTIVEESCNNKYDIKAQNVSEGGLEEADGQDLQDSVIDPNHSSDKQEGELLISESSSFSRDDRLHWDLNTDMAAWDASTEQVSEKVIDDEEAQEILHRSPSANSAETSQDHGNMGYDDDTGNRMEEEPESGEEQEELEMQRGDIDEEPDIREEGLEEEPDIVEPTVEDSGMGEEIREEEQEITEQNTPGVSEHREIDSIEKKESMPPSTQVESVWNAQDAADFPEPGKPGPWDADLSPDGRNAPELLETQCGEDDIPARHLPKSGKQAKSLSDDGEGWNYASEEPELEEHVDYGDSDFRDADDVGLDIDDRTSLMQEESTWKGDDGTGSLKRTSQEGDTSIADGTVVKASLCDGQPLERSPERHIPSGRSRTTGWDQLPEGFDNAEEALRAAKEVSVRRGGRGGSWSSPVGRASSLNSHTASRFGPGPGPARSTVRDGFSNARGDGYYGDRHPDEMMYDRDGYRHGRR